MLADLHTSAWSGDFVLSVMPNHLGASFFFTLCPTFGVKMNLETVQICDHYEPPVKSACHREVTEKKQVLLSKNVCIVG